ncbi:MULTISPECIES: cytochrome o ubiquinol oxidase subunit IV [Acinetobacter]|jgi:cytochrome o ubiquinol oxidase subunit IV|uniref:Cytochrome bo(3) ubiquinol oxidase subunit 4 n=1 Tax=Acinetobacter pollinis TaxID=2605270 RepID=A0ABU6DQV2_9GAMM|nr:MULTISPECIES: cytochrome o ubiquinol oxidase subunit IV [Acinetobacter]MBF7690771.1 cytochrome o ubiquinol oxidase subunit IV [Acinetobacter pollinis]MBF7693684.1 cytochrome o ubiquinol oxidase subunit IV [Acinetobacter pollinis]MBF7698375.1 cytochrome o ubiquinol oxidase subunit IV [Acinetobacter pollinis]MBF7701294.1 cytochrome o ubiquinol oxidase subunit IV [Acinetobacter pollinis]MEB5476247.1 cytochrome o ubiquinol oxidase subunit IV [Acinetobacter pollinis]
MSHGHHSDSGSHGSLKQYSIGFILSIILTVIPFGMVMTGGFSRSLLLSVVGITGIVQVLVQLIFFLHMNSSEEQRWNVIAFIYTILTIAILLIGSVWVMNYLHYNMMI